jgi:hypothetical protein
MSFVPGVAWVVILFQKTRELVPIEPPPACLQAGEKFEFAAGENRHDNAFLGSGPTAEVEHHVAASSGTPGHHFFCIPAYSLPL